jgi:hypothetical protein
VTGTGGLAGIGRGTLILYLLVRQRIFQHERLRIILILGLGALFGLNLLKEFLVLLPLVVSFLLVLTRLAYLSSWDGDIVNEIKLRRMQKAGPQKSQGKTLHLKKNRLLASLSE